MSATLGKTSGTVRFVLALSVVAVLAGCGKRNAPTAPPDQPNTYPRSYPSE